MDKKMIGKILFWAGLLIWGGSHLYILMTGGMSADMVMKHAWLNIAGLVAYTVGYMMLNK